jgi:hypothetical protein
MSTLCTTAEHFLRDEFPNDRRLHHAIAAETTGVDPGLWSGHSTKDCLTVRVPTDAEVARPVEPVVKSASWVNADL